MTTQDECKTVPSAGYGFFVPGEARFQAARASERVLAEPGTFFSNKQCPQCQQVKPLAAFYQRTDCLGRRRECGACRYLKTKKYIYPKWYRSFYSARNRCLNARHPNYSAYGGKGIKLMMTKEDFKTLWKRDGADRLADPTIDRIDPDGHYEITNCRFIERSENGRRARR